MTPKLLSRKIRKLPLKAPVTARYARALVSRGVWSSEGVWYKTQKEHWLGWLSEYDGPGAYNRKTRSGRSAEFVYNHINCPPMLLWLAEAADVSSRKVAGAVKSALAARRSRGSHCAVLRRIIPWSEIEQCLEGRKDRATSDILQLNLHREFFDAIALKQKRIEYRSQSAHWRKRLENRKYAAICFRNGYAKNAPEMLVEFRGLRRYGQGRNAYYAIRLGRVLEIRRWRRESRTA